MNDRGTETLPALCVELTHNNVNTTLQFSKPVLLIGRRSSSHSPDVAVDDPTVSRRHAEIRWLGKNYWIKDCNSLTGTFVNGERLPAGDQIPLNTGVRLKFGETAAVVRIDRHNDVGTYDIFLCHSGADKPQVSRIARELRTAGFCPFLDEDGLAATTHWISELSNILMTIDKAAVLWGPNSPGQWQMQEIEVIQKVAVETNIQLIPVILEGVPRDPDWPLFVDLIQRIDFRKSHQNPMNLLLKTLREIRRIKNSIATIWESSSKGLECIVDDLANLSSLCQRMDYPSSLNKIRYITEKLCYELCQTHGTSWGAAEPTLERMIGPLLAGNIIPKNVALHVRTVQTNSSAGSHYQESPLSDSHVSIALAALVEFLKWYQSAAEPLSGSCD